MQQPTRSVRFYIWGARLAEIGAMLQLVFAMATVVQAWDRLPHTIYLPSGIHGQSVVLGEKWLLMIPLLLLFLLYFLLTLYMRFYRLYRYPVPITERNRDHQILLLKGFFSYAKFVVAMPITYSIYVMLSVSLFDRPLWWNWELIAAELLLLACTALGYRWIARKNA